MNKIDTIIFDFGGVLVDWNPHYLYDSYFGDTKKTDYFLTNICTPEWNAQMDGGKPFADGIAEKIAEHPEYEKEIRMYWTDWKQMMGKQIDGMQELLQDLKAAGYHIYGLSNWSAETFYQVRNDYPIFDLLEGSVLSGEEKCLKPEPKIYTILLDRYHINPNTAVFFDDNLANVEGAKAVGIHGIQFVSAEQIRKELGL
jgi:2-haloacid dehalogenase